MPIDSLRLKSPYPQPEPAFLGSGQHEDQWEDGDEAHKLSPGFRLEI